jgi:hypothetical protein
VTIVDSKLRLISGPIARDTELYKSLSSSGVERLFKNGDPLVVDGLLDLGSQIRGCVDSLSDRLYFTLTDVHAD